ncbi:MAG: glycine/betaine ABC transporter substrate-binding protein [Firmicutes bacterium]|nr:glycine/betaine ABC transporter substrate-binding protein [Bacillota bacterium]
MGKRRIISLLLCVFLLVVSIGVGGCGGDKAGSSGKVVIASKQFAENLIFAHVAALLIENNTDLKVDISKIGMGPTEMLHPALAEGEIDLYLEYTGTAWTTVLKGDMLHDSQEVYEKVREAYRDRFGITCLETLGFENTFAIVVRKDVAEELNLSKISDLAEHPELVFIGDSTTFTRPDIYPALQEAYNLDLQQKMVDTTFKLDAVAEGEGDLTNAYTTDGRLKDYDVVLLEDEKKVFPPYYAIYVIRTELLEQHPEIEEALKPLINAIDEEMAMELNYKVEAENQDPADVAEEFLKSRGLI